MAVWAAPVRFRRRLAAYTGARGSWMKPALKCLAILGFYGLFLAGPLTARADVDDDGDHDRARDLYERGEIKGLSSILDLVHSAAPGDIVAVDFIRIADRWVYRFQIVVADGHRRIVDVDAGAGVLMRSGGGD